MAALAAPLLDIRNLVTEFRTESGIVRAVKGVDLTVEAGQTVAVVGESGSGKSVTSLSVMRLIPKAIGGIASGAVMFKGRDGQVRDLVHESEDAMRKLRGNEIAMIFQEPMTSLNPTQKVGTQIAEVALLHQGLTRKQAWQRAIDMLALVEIPEPARRADIYPHQMSGGMRQRVMIAMAQIGRASCRERVWTVV